MASLMDFMSNGKTSPFQVFENVQTPTTEKVELNLPLSDSPIALDWASGISPSGIPIVKNNETQESKLKINNNPEESIISDKDTQESTITSTKSNKVEKKSKEDAKNFFIKKGLSPHQAAGIVGNLIQESNLNTKIKGDSGTSYGIAQWRGDRLIGLKNFAKELGTDISDFKTQLEYIWKELNSTHKGALNGILNSRNLDEATTAFMSKFEKPNSKYANLTARIKYAKSCL